MRRSGPRPSAFINSQHNRQCRAGCSGPAAARTLCVPVSEMYSVLPSALNAKPCGAWWVRAWTQDTVSSERTRARALRGRQRTCSTAVARETRGAAWVTHACAGRQRTLRRLEHGCFSNAIRAASRAAAARDPGCSHVARQCWVCGVEKVDDSNARVLREPDLIPAAAESDGCVRAQRRAARVRRSRTAQRAITMRKCFSSRERRPRTHQRGW